MERRAYRREASATSVSSCNLPRPQAAPTSPRDTYIKQLEEYSEGVEGDYAELHAKCEQQASDLKAARALLDERKLHEGRYRAMETELREHESFLAELLPLLSCEPETGLRSSKDLNKPRKKLTAASSQKKAESPVTIDSVRDAAQKRHLRMRELIASDSCQRSAMRALEKDLVKAQREAAARPSAPAGATEDCFLPGGAKEVSALRQELRSLEGKLATADKETRDLSTELKKNKLEAIKWAATVKRHRSELESLRGQLTSKEQAVADTERRCKAAEEQLMKQQQQQDPHQREYAPSESSKLPTRPGLGASTEQLVTTRHYHLFSGEAHAHLLRTSPDAFKDVVIRALSGALHVPYGYVSNTDIRPAAVDAGVSVEADIQHSTSLSETDVDSLLAAYAFGEMHALKEAALQSEISAASTLTEELRESRRSLEAKRVHLRDMQRRIGALEASLERRDAEQEGFDQDVSEALTETEVTIKSLCRQLEEQQQACEHAKVDATRYRALAKEVQVRLTTCDAELQSARTMLAERTASLHTAELRVTALEKEMSTLSGSRQAEVTAQSHKLSETEAQLVEVRDNLSVLTEMNKALQEAVVSQQTQRTKAEQTLRDLHDDVARHKQLCADAEKELRAAREDATRYRAKCTEAEAGRRELEDTVATVEACLMTALTSAEKRSATSAAKQAQVLVERVTTQERILRSSRLIEKELKEAASAQQAELAIAQGMVAELTQAQTSAVASAQFSGEETQRLQKAMRAQAEAATAAENARQQQVRQLEDSLRMAAERAVEVEEAQKEAQGALKEDVTAMKRELARAREAESRAVESQAKGSATVIQLRKRVEELESQLRSAQRQTADATAAAARKSAELAEKKALVDSLEAAAREKAALAQQLAEMEIDLSDFANIQTSMQGELDRAQQELRCKKNEVEMVTARLVRIEQEGQALKEEVSRLRATASTRQGGSGAADGSAAVSALPSPVGAKDAARPTPSSTSRRAAAAGMKPPANRSGATRTSKTGNSNLVPQSVVLKDTPGRSAAATGATATTSPHSSTRRITHRSSSAKVFSRTISSSSISHAVAMGGGSAGSHHPADSPVPATYGPSNGSSGSGGGGSAKASKTVETPPRLGDFARQHSRGYYTNGIPTSLQGNPRTSTDDLVHPHERKPIATHFGRTYSSGGPTMPRGAGVSFHRSHSAVCGSGPSFVRSASGQQRRNDPQAPTARQRPGQVA